MVLETDHVADNLESSFKIFGSMIKKKADV